MNHSQTPQRQVPVNPFYRPFMRLHRSPSTPSPSAEPIGGSTAPLCEFDRRPRQAGSGLTTAYIAVQILLMTPPDGQTSTFSNLSKLDISLPLLFVPHGANTHDEANAVNVIYGAVRISSTVRGLSIDFDALQDTVRYQSQTRNSVTQHEPRPRRVDYLRSITTTTSLHIATSMPVSRCFHTPRFVCRFRGTAH